MNSFNFSKDLVIISSFNCVYTINNCRFLEWAGPGNR